MGKDSVKKDSYKDRMNRKIMYLPDDSPPWRLSFLLGLQHYLTHFGIMMMVPLLVADVICAGHDAMVKNSLISATMLMCGIATFLQATYGVRLPMMIGPNFVYVIPLYSMMNMPEWQCEAVTVINGTNGTELQYDTKYPDRIREIMGAVMIASAVQILTGFLGIIGFISSRIGPIVFAAAIMSVGLAIMPSAVKLASKCWPVSILTVTLVAVFWMYCSKVLVPFVTCSCRKKHCKFHIFRLPVFSSFPVFLAIIISWLLCLVLTLTNVFSPEPGGFGYAARTDLSSQAISESAWIRVPYPFQWGFPTVTTTLSIGMIIGMVATLTDSVSDYHATARAAGATIPPSSAVNRGIFIEGILSFLAGMLGSGTGTGTATGNVAIIAITRVGSARVAQCAGFLSILLGIFGKFGAIFATIPDPVAGGVLLILFGAIFSLGLQNLQFVDLKLMRNVFSVGVPVHIGFASMYYFSVTKQEDIATGIDIVDQLIRTIFGNNIVVACILALFFDATLPGTPEERGLVKWREEVGSLEQLDALSSGESQLESVKPSADKCDISLTEKTEIKTGKAVEPVAKNSSYDWPCGMNYLRKHKIFSKFPISPTYKHKVHKVQKTGKHELENAHEKTPAEADRELLKEVV